MTFWKGINSYGRAGKMGSGHQAAGAAAGGRLAEYKYYDMAPVIEKVMGMEIFVNSIMSLKS
jgi:UDP-galactopyranose mutase